MKIKTQHIMKVIMAITTLFVMSVQMYATEISITPTTIERGEITQNVSPYAYEYEWRYTNIDGRAHKRLWNLTLGRWEGNWIPM